MKIIFDSEENKERFCKLNFCPSDITGNPKDDSCDVYESSDHEPRCMECWDTCPVQLEVTSNENHI